MKELGKTPASRVRIDEETEGQRIDNFLLRHCKRVPKSHIYRILRSGEVRINGGRVGPDYRLRVGDEMRIPPIRIETVARPAVPLGRPYRILHEDAGFLVIDKPAGMAVHGGSGVNFGVIEQLRRQRPQERHLELVHRLDRETSGLLLVARKRQALKALHEQFREGGVEKRYLALVRGNWTAGTRHIRLPLARYLTEGGERRVSVSPEGKPAHSIVRRRAQLGAFSLLEVELRTGRTHQIRVHLTHLGFPLCGDDKYGDFALNRELRKQGLERMFLHAERLALSHPTTGLREEFTAALPDELQRFLSNQGLNDQYELEIPAAGL